MLNLKALNKARIPSLLFPKFVFARIHHLLTEKQFLIFSSICVGLFAGLAAVILKSFVYSIRQLFLDVHYTDITYAYILLPAIGLGLVIFLIKPFLKHEVNPGSVNILHCIAKKGSNLPFEQVYSHILTSGLTVGFGGSAGLESPIVATGSAIGSNYSRVNQLNYKTRTLLLAAGAAGGIAGAFNAPIAGLLFALEVILTDISITAFIPLLIASVSGGLISTIILKEEMLLSFAQLKPFDYHNLPFYVLLAFAAGLMSVYYVNFFQRIEKRFENFKSKTLRWLLGSLVLMVLLFLFPSLFGEGYESIKLLSANDARSIFTDSPFNLISFSQGWMIILLTAILFLKVYATAATIGAGGVGGNFAPSLFVGAYLGFIFAYVFRLMNINLPLSNFTLVAMAGILSGVFHAPLTAIFLIAEISGGYALIIPLMIVSSVSYLIVKYFHPESMDLKKLKQRGALLPENKDTHILNRIKIENLIERDSAIISPGESLKNVVEQFKHTRKNILAVVDHNYKLMGIIQLDNTREEVFNPKLHDNIIAKEIMEKPASTITKQDNIPAIMRKFDETGQWNLPLVENERFKGFISKTTILTCYRHELIESLN